MYDNTVRIRVLRLLADGLSISEAGRRTGVSRAAIREWRDDPNALTPRVPASCVRCGSPPRPPDDPVAYAYLLGLYLGDGCISPAGDPAKHVWALRIACADAYPGLIAECAAAMATVLPNSVFRVRGTGYTMVTSTSKHWPCLFPQLGPGTKHSRRIILEPWQRRITDAHAGAFIRGLIHSDGTRFINRVRRPLADGDHWYAYPRYQFVNESADIREFAAAALTHLGVAWRYSRHNTISVARKDAVARLDGFVGVKY
ncbi:MAG TPA: helix-turn-helix domain-containing protein [Streptosporangiaceae bacterium]|jgi:hypothetical protein